MQIIVTETMSEVAKNPNYNILHAKLSKHETLSATLREIDPEVKFHLHNKLLALSGWYGKLCNKIHH